MIQKFILINLNFLSINNSLTNMTGYYKTVFVYLMMTVGNQITMANVTLSLIHI